MASLSAALSHSLFLFLLCIACSTSKSSVAHEGEGRPLAAPAQRLRSVLLSEADLRGRRLTGSFQLCALCTCCGGPRGLCLPSPCCYAINCNIPNRPFGFCSFTPKTCNCFGCHL